MTNEQKQREALLLCPFCGALPEYQLIFGNDTAVCRTIGCPVSQRCLMVGVWNRRAAQAAAVPVVPNTPEQVIAFIGSHFSRRYDTGIDNVLWPKEEWMYALTVHDLLSAFDDLRDAISAAPSAEQGE